MESISISKLQDLFKNSGIVVLAGSGISVESGLPAGEPFLKNVIELCSADDSAKKLLMDLIDFMRPHGNWLRFEGLLEAVQRFVDPELEILQIYNHRSDHSAEPNLNHRILKNIATHYVVFTTNFDCLIEEAMPEKHRAALCFVTEDSWQSVHKESSISRGLWKLHGTLLRWDSGWEDPGDAGPVATLRAISRTRHSPVRKAYFKKLLETHPVLIVGYSGLDDFDVSLWIREAVGRHPIIWVMHDSGQREPQFFRGEQVADGSGVLSPFLMRLSQALCENPPPDGTSAIKNLIVVKCHTMSLLKNLFPDVVGQYETKWVPLSPHDNQKRLNAFLSAWAKDRIDLWAKNILTGKLLAHLMHFRQAMPYLNESLQQANTESQKAASLVSLSETEVEIDDIELHHQAVSHAKEVINKAKNTPWQYPAQIAYASALECDYYPNEEKERKAKEEAMNRFKGVLNSDADSFEKSEAVSRITYLKRHTNFTIEGKDLLDWGLERGDLFSEAERRHEKARELWSNAQNTSTMENAIKEMDAAVQLWEDIGDIGGQCRSLNVQGLMCHRLCDWVRWESGEAVLIQSRVARAASLHQHSLELARQDDYERLWDEGQACQGLCVLSLRWENDWQSTLKWFEQAEKKRYINHTRDNIRLEFLRALLAFFRFDDFVEGVRESFILFEKLLNYYGKPGQQKVVERVVGAAKINMKACRIIMGDDTDLELSKMEVPKQIKNPYWGNRIKFLAGALQDPSREKLRRFLLDPLAG